MSGATYRIDVEHHPDPALESGIHWMARVTRLSDESQIANLWASSGDEAAEKARAWLLAQNVKQDGRTLYVNDEGEPV